MAELIKQISIKTVNQDGLEKIDVRPIGVDGANVTGPVANATVATKLGTVNKGSETQPIYLENGVPTATTKKLEADVPSDAKFTDTTYTAGTGLSLSGTTINHSNSIVAATVGSKSGTIKIPWITYDDQGHITSTGSINLTSATETAAGLMSADDKKAVNSLINGSYDLPTATTTVLGGVKIGNNINVNSGVISITKASDTTKGFVNLTAADYIKLTDLLSLVSIS